MAEVAGVGGHFPRLGGVPGGVGLGVGGDAGGEGEGGEEGEEGEDESGGGHHGQRDAGAA